MKAWAVHEGENRDGELVGAQPAGGLDVRVLTRTNTSGSIPTVQVRSARTCINSDDFRNRFRFVLVRHPLRRVVSAFHDKVEVENCSYPPFKWVCALPIAKRWPEFVNRLVEGRFSDSHVMSMGKVILSVHLRSQHPLHAIVRTEDLDSLWPWILDCARYDGRASGRTLLHGNAKPLSSQHDNHSANAPTYLDDPHLLVRLVAYYRDDFEAFGYDVASVTRVEVAAMADLLQRKLNLTSTPTNMSALSHLVAQPPMHASQCHE